MEKSLVNDQTSKQKLQRKLDRVKRYRAPALPERRASRQPFYVIDFISDVNGCRS